MPAAAAALWQEGQKQGPGYLGSQGGFLDGEKIVGRPADILQAPDGSLLVADDQTGAGYQITVRKQIDHVLQFFTETNWLHELDGADAGSSRFHERREHEGVMQ